MSWRSFDKTSTRTLVLTAYRGHRVDGAAAWDMFVSQGLWEDKEEAFHHYHNGLETFETQKELWRAPDEFKDKADELIRDALQQQIITKASETWLRDLFGLPSSEGGEQ